MPAHLVVDQLCSLSYLHAPHAVVGRLAALGRPSLVHCDAHVARPGVELIFSRCRLLVCLACCLVALRLGVDQRAYRSGSVHQTNLVVVVRSRLLVLG